ncbi:MAG: 16S rRNA (guanine(527)-N(7))-methyltransferase RsmG [Deltaproteobacteria bacterium]|nr:16S rRNA (guanine(527)-N(7))-methyltransferase RsmG [Deltaproteobacteria bacterium]
MTALGDKELSELLAGAGIAVPEDAAAKLVRHAGEMLRWNRAVRLTAITAPREVAVKHILDSLLLLAFSPFTGRTLDFGSGAGYPGIPLAIVLPEARVVMLESSAKKCAFLSHACAMLGLRNAEVVRGRLVPGSVLPIGLFEQIVTRATLPPLEAARLLVPYLSPGGRLLLMTGPGKGEGGTDDAGGESGGEDMLPPGAAYGRRERFALPRGMGSREIREVRAK